MFNEEAGNWGMQHGHVAEIPLALSKFSEKEQRCLVDIERQGEIGSLRSAWSPNQWTANFKLTL